VPHTVPTPKPQHSQTLPTITLFSQCLCLLLLPSHCWPGGKKRGLRGGEEGGRKKEEEEGGGEERRKGKKEGRERGREEEVRKGG